MIFHDYSGFFFSNSMTFPCMELFKLFSRVSVIPRACGNPVDIPTFNSNGKLQKSSFLTELTIFETIEIVSMCYSATMQTKFSRHPRQKTSALSPAAFGPRAYCGCWHSKIICNKSTASTA